VAVLFLGAIGPAIPEEPKQSPAVSAPENHRESIEITIETENRNNEELKVSLDLAEKFKKAMATETVYSVQLSAYGNILLLPQTTVADLEKAKIDTLSARDAIDAKIKEIADRTAPFAQMLNQTREQLSLNEKQLADLASGAGTGDSVTGNLKKNLQTLISLLTAKQKRIEKILDIYQPLKLQLEETRTAISELSEKLNRQIAVKKKEALFQRRVSPLFALNVMQIKEEVAGVLNKAWTLISEDLRSVLTRSFWETTGHKVMTALFAYTGILWGMLRIRRIGRTYEQSGHLTETPWSHLAFCMLEKSLILSGTTVFVAGFVSLQHESADMTAWNIALNFLWFWLQTQWGLVGIQTWNRLPLPVIPERIFRGLRFGLRSLRIFGIVYLMLDWFLGGSGNILVIARILFGIGMLTGFIHFWKAAGPSISGISGRFPQIRTIVGGIGYAITGLGPVLELTGYGYLAIYWFSSWITTIIVAFWSGILMMTIREWQRVFKKRQTTDVGLQKSPHHTRQWLLLRTLWIVWFPLSFIAVLMAWGAKNAVVFGIFKVVNYPVPIGDMQFSVLGVVCAVITLVFTHLFTRLWRRMLREKFLAGSGMDTGLKDSITTISIYLIWTMGIFISLRMVGVSSTSLTVVFGALSIGLGFGLQNIFNNFISGIILLFERPIQVGDAVEIGGVWGVVQKINVRSTLVQTYDNASLIIPNSEFISNKVINWSFKDHRIRKVITVGVAYGTDTSLVSATLREIAGKAQWVLKLPEPDVLFSDFGDSALIFKLRVWTLVDQMVKVETHIRFEIERLFRERQIQMPFPQRDVHIIENQNLSAVVP
jgi:small-conductance mechanosensitive channel